MKMFQNQTKNTEQREASQIFAGNTVNPLMDNVPKWSDKL